MMTKETYRRPLWDDSLLPTSLKHHGECFVTQGGIQVLRAAFTFVAAILQFHEDGRIRIEIRLFNGLGTGLLFCVIPFHR
jgi:CTP-dependent riboflavin kinase